ncbi:MAG: lipopolysaccharide biosynthesis protein [Chloroflexota bacterium]
MLANPFFRRVVKNSGYLFSATGLTAAAGMLQGVLVTRLLGVSGYGILGAITLFTSLVNNFVSFRMSEIVVKYVGQYSENGDQPGAAAVFKLAALVEMLASLLAFALLYLLAPLGARYLAKDPSAAGWFVAYGLVVLANLIAESSTGLLQIFNRFRRVAVLSVAGSLVTLAVTAVVYLAGGGLLGVLLAYLAGKSFSALGLTLSALGEAAWRWGPGWWRTPLAQLAPRRSELARFAISTNISASLSLVTKDSELLWVSLLRGPLETGYYRLALSLSNLVQMPVNVLPQATYPELSRQAAVGNWKGMRSLLRHGTLLAGGYTLAAALFLGLFGRPLIAWVYTPDFLPAYPALMILLVGLLVANTFYWRRTALLALGQAGYPARVNLALAALKLLAIVALVPRFGYLASAALLSAFYWAGTFATVWKTYAVMRARERTA